MLILCVPIASSVSSGALVTRLVDTVLWMLDAVMHETPSPSTETVTHLTCSRLGSTYLHWSGSIVLWRKRTCRGSACNADDLYPLTIRYLFGVQRLLAKSNLRIRGVQEVSTYRSVSKKGIKT